MSSIGVTGPWHARWLLVAPAAFSSCSGEQVDVERQLFASTATEFFDLEVREVHDLEARDAWFDPPSRIVRVEADWWSLEGYGIRASAVDLSSRTVRLEVLNGEWRAAATRTFDLGSSSHGMKIDRALLKICRDTGALEFRVAGVVDDTREVWRGGGVVHPELWSGRGLDNDRPGPVDR